MIHKLLNMNQTNFIRNNQGKTPRDIAVELNLTDNVQQIDEFIYELVANENLKQLTDLIVLGFDDLLTIVERKYGNAEKMEETGLGKGPTRRGFREDGKSTDLCALD